MSETPIADMIEKMDAAGASVAVILAAVRAYEQRYVTRNVTSRDAQRTVTPKSNTAGAIRARRHRVKIKQLKALAEANDAAIRASGEALRSTVTVTPSGTHHCDLSSSLSSEGTTEEGKKERVVTRARAKGTRLPEDWRPNVDDRQFARDHGVDPDAAFPEFRDYWIGVPGQRGVKLDWSATWRNRVRDVAGRKSSRRGGDKPSMASIARDLMNGFHDDEPPIDQSDLLDLTANRAA